jgi:hypothetical protein
LGPSVFPEDGKPQFDFFFTLLPATRHTVPAGCEGDLSLTVCIIRPESKASRAGGREIVNGENGGNPKAFGNLHNIVAETNPLVEMNKIGIGFFQKKPDCGRAHGAVCPVPKIAVCIRSMEPKGRKGEIVPLLQTDLRARFETSMQEKGLLAHRELCPAECIHIGFGSSMGLRGKTVHNV